MQIITELKMKLKIGRKEAHVTPFIFIFTFIFTDQILAVEGEILAPHNLFV